MQLKLVIVTLETGASQTIHIGMNSDALSAISTGLNHNKRLSRARNTTFTPNR
jgi:hypothetical protein